MKVRFLFAAMFLAFAGLLPAGAEPPAEPVPPPKTKAIVLPDGRKFIVGDRAKMRMKTNKRFAINNVMKVQIPAPPVDGIDYTNDKSGKRIALPMHGNDQLGDCFYVAPVHIVESQLGYRGIPVTFSDRALEARYLKIAGGDNGLSDDQIMPEWEQGIVGPKGPHKIVDYALINPTDWASVTAAVYHLGGVVTTHELRTSWESVSGDEFVWDNTGQIDTNAGHAIGQHGFKGDRLRTSTWGMRGWLTKAGLANSDAEVIAIVSLDWFDAKGFTPNGTHYTEIATYWKAATGRQLPVGLFPDPTPTPPTPPNPPGPPGPNPPTPGKLPSYTRTVVVKDGLIIRDDKVDAGGGGILPDPVVGKEYTIDLSKLKDRPVIQERVKNRIMKRVRAESIVEGVEVAITDNGDSITISPKSQKLASGKAGFDWNAFFNFIMKILPLILAAFGVGDVEPTGMLIDPTTWYAAAGCYWHLVA